MLVNVTENVITSLSSLNINFPFFKGCKIILADVYLNIIYIYNFEDGQDNKILKVGDSLNEDIIMKNAFSVAKNKKVVSSVYVDENPITYFNKTLTVAAPIQKDNGEIVSFIGIFTKNKKVEYFIPFTEMLAKLIYEKIIKYLLKLSLINDVNTEHKKIEMLSDREITIIDLIKKGLKDTEIAKSMSISMSTVHSHLNSIYQKTNINNRPQLVALYDLYIVINILENICYWKSK